jgi:AcrR family transcriptional regulator
LGDQTRRPAFGDDRGGRAKPNHRLREQKSFKAARAPKAERGAAMPVAPGVNGITMPKVKPETSMARRDEILDAAEICFAREGFHQSTIRHVIRESGLSAGCIYGYFPTKDDLIQAMGERRHAHDDALLAARDKSADPIAALRTVAREFLADLQKEDGLRIRRVGLQLWAEALRSDEVKRQVVSGTRAPIAAITELLRRGQRLGLIDRKLDPPSIARAMVAMFQGLVLQSVWGEPFEMTAALKAFDSFLRGLAPASR